MDIDLPRKMEGVKKFCGNQLRSKRYEVRFNELYKAPCSFSPSSLAESNIAEDSDDDMIYDDHVADGQNNEQDTQRYPSRLRRKPDYLATAEI